MKRRSTVLAAALLILAAIVPPASSAATPNSVLIWNQHTIEAIVNATNAPVPGAQVAANVSIYYIAMVQGAVYDAVNSIDGGYRPFVKTVAPAASTANQDAAVAAAARGVLVGFVPALPQVVLDRINLLYDTFIANLPADQATTDGVAAGEAAAAAMLANRAGDGRFGDFRFTPSDVAGEWRPTLPTFVNDPFAWVARLRPFTLKSTSQFRTVGQPDLTSEQYTEEYNEVKSLGSLTGSARNTEQNAIAAFFTDNPIVMWNRTFRTIAMDENLSVADSARLLGRIAISAGDTVIACWDNKAFHSNWRPIDAIRRGDDDGNPATEGQGDWTPLLPTPPYPDISSGYNCYSAAVMYTAGDFFGTDKFTFTAHSNASNTDRTYTRFSRVLRDTIDARIYQGLHFRTADVAGAWLGKKVAHWVDKHEFQPVD